MDPRNREALEAKVAQAAAAALAAKKFVAPIDIIVGLGWLTLTSDAPEPSAPLTKT